MTHDPVHLPLGGRLIAGSLLALVAVVLAFVLTIYFTIQLDRESRSELVSPPTELATR